jgi:hypothetical protein
MALGADGLDQELGALVREIVRRLNNKNLTSSPDQTAVGPPWPLSE